MTETTHDIEQYLSAQKTTFPSFDSRGETLAFLLDTTGTPQIWTSAEPSVWPTQRTYFGERIRFVDWSPTRNEFAFGMDSGSDERDQLYRYDIDRGTVTRLTDSPSHKHEWGGWTSDGDRFAFASNRRDRAEYDLYVQHRDDSPGEARSVYEGDERMTLYGWSPDDTRMLARLEHASFDQDLEVIDVETGEATTVTTHDGENRYAGVQWDADGESLYLVTNAGSDTMYFARLVLATNAIETVVDGGDWDVETVAVEPESRRVAYSRNVDGYSEIHVGELVGDAEFDELATPSLPDGVLAGFRPDGQLTVGPGGERVALAYECPTSPPTIYQVDVESGATDRWTTPSTAGIPTTDFDSPETVRFETFDGREIPALFTLPDDTERDGAPVVVDIHGGPEGQRRPQFSPVRQYLLDAGYAVFEPNVRGSFGYGKAFAALDDVENRMDAVADLKAGVEWLHDRGAVNPDRIVAYGASYGGFMVLAALTEYPDLWAAGVDRVGIANFVTFLENTSEWRQDHRAAEYGTLEGNRAFLEDISPVNNIETINAPLVVLHGENDPRVPIEESRRIADAASEHVPVETVYFDDEGHQFTKLTNRISAYRRIVDFLDEYV